VPITRDKVSWPAAKHDSQIIPIGTAAGHGRDASSASGSGG
jgi:hypothetical protein